MVHVRTITHCTIMKVSKNDFRRALAWNPIAARELEDSVEEFQKDPVLL